MLDRELYRYEKLWLLRNRLGMKQKEMPVSHMTWIRWENGRRWNSAADEQLAYMETLQQ